MLSLGQTSGRCEHQMIQFIFSNNYSVARMNLFPFRSSFLNQIKSNSKFHLPELAMSWHVLGSPRLGIVKKNLGVYMIPRKWGPDLFPGVLIIVTLVPAATQYWCQGLLLPFHWPPSSKAVLAQRGSCNGPDCLASETLSLWFSRLMPWSLLSTSIKCPSIRGTLGKGISQ